MTGRGDHGLGREMKRAMRVKIHAGVALAALLSGAAACGGNRGAEAEGGGQETVVALSAEDVATVRTDTFQTGVVVSGTLEPYRDVEVRAQVPGTVMDLRVDRGDAVRAGQPLARIEAAGIRGAAASARAGVASAEAQVALARRQLDSSQKLHDAGALSDLEYQQAQAAFEAAQAQLAAAKAQAAGANESARRATVTAPISGEVSERTVNEGEAVNPGQALLSIVDATQLELAGQVGVDEALEIHPGMTVVFQVAAFPGRTFEGKVARVEPTADRTTRQVGVYARLPNESRSLVGGVYATGRILTGGSELAAVVPTGAVRGEGAEQYVYVIRDGVAVRQPVVVGGTDVAAGTTEITQGLQDGETVIVSPGEIRDGEAVRIGEAKPPVAEEEQ